MAVEAAAIAAVPAAPLVTGGGSAFVTWVATPHILSGPDAQRAAQACFSVRFFDATEEPVRAVLAEKRGNWVFVLYEGRRGEGVCRMLVDGSRKSGYSGDLSGYSGNFSPERHERPNLPPDGFYEWASTGNAVEGKGMWPVKKPDEWFWWVTGYVGSDVVSVTVHPPVGPDVEATVNEGRFGAWWPGGEARGDNPGSNGGAWYYTVTHVDGTTREVTGDERWTTED